MTPRRKFAKGAGALFAALVGALILSSPSLAGKLPAPGSYVLQRIQRAPDATLLDSDGNFARLSTYTKGAVTALAFFFSHCVDPRGCPVAWSTFEEARKDAAVDPLLETKLRLVFVSLDPQRDTPAVLRLLQSTESGGAIPWVFLTSPSRAALAPLLRDMGQDIAADASGALNHMLKVFLIDPDGWTREIYSTAFLTPESLLNDARTLALEFPNADNGAKER